MNNFNLQSFYSDFYADGDDHDSPRASRVRMARRILNETQRCNDMQQVLDIGAGRGAVEDILRRRDEANGLTLISFDIATITKDKLLSLDRRTHVQADSRDMPFADGIFDLAFSNLSIDMLRRNQNPDYETALRQTRRVLGLGAVLLLSLHSAKLFKKLSRQYTGDHDMTADYFNGNKADNPFYDSQELIISDLKKADFKEIEIEKIKDKKEEWWEVRAVAA